ncbi:class I adenylate-forming enzyme family protein [Paraeggerthella sp. Marseille-Q4926]|uniref:class I adenylate-forming enzyme family protein n=1 Tax=Paraeggerthella sp. Marseille-Q4926 TaxID=2866587 RepID=UPI001CE3E766|nr:AMP-binding protein [Paraeggerthella sp. Marseille-Q4926]
MSSRHEGIPQKSIDLAQQLRRLAEAWGDETALVEVANNGSERSMSRKELFEAVEKVASHLHAQGVAEGDFVAVALPNCLEHAVVTIAAWQLGACCVFMPPKGTASEKRDLLGLIDCRLLVSDWDFEGSHGAATREDVREWMAGDFPEGSENLPFFACTPMRAVATGGSSGKPKLVVQGIKPAYCGADLESWTAMTGQIAWGRQLVPGALFHNLYNNTTYIGLFFGQTVYLMERFNAARALELIEKHQIDCIGLVPTMMERMMAEPSFTTRNLSSLKAVFHSGGPCPDRVKLGWIDRLGADRVYEMYAATEMVGSAVIRGDEWLEHRGSVGRPVGCAFQIRSEEGEVLPAGQVGEIFGKPVPGLITHYVGAPSIAADDEGYCSVGDMGWLDADGYLYISDRRVDMIVTGGKNVYTAEVENALFDYPGIQDAVVIGIPDEEWGRRVHAILELEAGADASSISFDDLSAFLRTKISGYKCPKTFEIIECMPRTDFGKIRRKELIDQRLQGLSEHEPCA